MRPREALSQVSALQAIHARGSSALADCVRSPVRRAEDLLRLRSILDRAAAAIEYAESPRQDDWSSTVSTAVHLRYALRMLFLFGQAAAMPTLLDTKDPVTVASLVAHGPSGIDAWSLTDLERRTAWRVLPPARAAIERMWAVGPSPTATVRVQAQIDAALLKSAMGRLGQKGGPHHVRRADRFALIPAAQPRGHGRSDAWRNRCPLAQEHRFLRP